MNYDVVFDGTIINGFSTEQVKSNLSKALKVEAQKLEHLFSGEKVVLKQNVDENKAQRIVKQLSSLGAKAEIKAVLEGLDFKIEDIVKETNNSDSPPSLKVSSNTTTRPEVPLSDTQSPDNISEKSSKLRILFSLLCSPKFLLSVLLMIVGVIGLAIFFPWPDGVFRRGFFAAIIAVLIGYKYFRVEVNYFAA